MNSLHNVTKFTPDPKHLEFAEMYVKHRGNITKACEEMGEGRHLYYVSWRKQEGFEEWLQDYAKNAVLKRFGKWYLILEKFAERGSYQHLNMLLQIAREFLPAPLVDQSKHTHLSVTWKENGKRVNSDRLRSALAPVRDTRTPRKIQGGGDGKKMGQDNSGD